MRKWYHVIKNAFTEKECAEIVAEACKLPPIEASVGHGGQNAVRSGIRRSTVRWLDRAGREWQDVFNRLQAAGNKANADYFGFDLSHFDNCQFTEYSCADTQHYDWHQDNTFVPAADCNSPFDRKLSMVLQCSPKSNYEGGELWVNPSRQEKVNGFDGVGSIVVFPSFLWHKVTPVTQGVRHSLVTWFTGPRFR